MGEPTQSIAIDGRCLCGDTRYHLEGECFGILYCHCQRCRKQTGAALAGFLSFAEGTITWQAGRDDLGVYNTERSHRAFCRRCGSCMPLSDDESTRFGNIYAGNILQMEPPLFAGHVFTASSCPWYPLPEAEPYWATVAPEFEEYDPKLANHQRRTEPGRITGSCLCGNVAFSAGTPLYMMNCHCTRCRLSRCAPHATNLFVSPDDFEWVSGAEKIAEYKIPEAERFTAAHCSDCGSLVPHVGSEQVCVPAGCLDSDPGIAPRGHIFVGSKARWFAIHDDLPQWQEGPPRS